MKAIKTKNVKIKFLIFSSVFLLLIAFFTSCSQNASFVTPDRTNAEAESIESSVKSEKKEIRFDIEKTVFVGDSNIFHLKTYGILPSSQIITGKECYMTLEPSVYQKHVVFAGFDEEMTIHDAISRIKPEFLIITLGTDGAASLDYEGFRLSYTQLLDLIVEASPDTVIGVQSIFPVREGLVNVRFKSPKETNEKFKLANSWLYEIAEEYRIAYFDTFSILADVNGNLKEEYNTDHLDGYHLNKKGLLAMLEYIKKFTFVS